jgi:carbonic anhydrase/acetyltransferase-like protein (isoleucine patch superfamily)
LDASFNSNIYVAKNATVYGNANISNNANISGTIYVGGISTMASNLNVLGNATVNNAATVQGVLYVAGNSTLASNLNVSKNTTLQGTLTVANNTTISSNLTVVGNTTINNSATVQGVLNVLGNTILSSNLNVLRNANLSKQLFVGETLYVVGNATMATNLIASNAFITTLSVSGNTTMSNNLNLLGNANVAKTLYVGSDTTLGSNFKLFGNANISKNATIAGEVLGFGNITATQNIYAKNSVYATNYDGIMTTNAGELNSDLTMGLSVPGLNTRNIKIGNFVGTGTVNNIFLGGGQDVVVMGGTIINNQNIKAGQILYLNTPIFDNGTLVGDNSSVGSGIVFADSGNASVGYITVPTDKSGFLFRSTDQVNANVLKFDVKNSVLPDSYASGLITLQPSGSSSESNYTMAVGSIDPDNILLGNKYLATESSPQVIDTTVSIVGHVSVGDFPSYSQSQCALEVVGNIYQTDGLVWQF